MAELPKRRLRAPLRALPFAIALAAGLASFFVSAESRAQLHWDASAQVGVSHRFLADRPTGASDAGFGPIGQVTGHVALLPLVRVGGYFGHDISPMSGDASARQITFGGIRVKGMLPWIRGSVRAWVFAGFGYTGVYAPSFGTTFQLFDEGANTTTATRVRVEGAGGGFFDVPFGFGASYNLFKPWALCAELGGRANFGHTGSLYDQPGPRVSIPGQASQNASPAGLDRFGLGLTVGVLVDF